MLFDEPTAFGKRYSLDAAKVVVKSFLRLVFFDVPNSMQIEWAAVAGFSKFLTALCFFIGDLRRCYIYILHSCILLTWTSPVFTTSILCIHPSQISVLLDDLKLPGSCTFIFDVTCSGNKVIKSTRMQPPLNQARLFAFWIFFCNCMTSPSKFDK